MFLDCVIFFHSFPLSNSYGWLSFKCINIFNCVVNVIHIYIYKNRRKKKPMKTLAGVVNIDRFTETHLYTYTCVYIYTYNG